MSGAVPPLPNTPSWRGARLGEHRDNFTLFTFYNHSIILVLTMQQVLHFFYCVQRNLAVHSIQLDRLCERDG
jgi:hypothetical protein